MKIKIKMKCTTCRWYARIESTSDDNRPPDFVVIDNTEKDKCVLSPKWEDIQHPEHHYCGHYQLKLPTLYCIVSGRLLIDQDHIKAQIANCGGCSNHPEACFIKGEEYEV